MKYISIVFLLLLSASGAFADQVETYETEWLTEKVGNYIPLDATFADEDGRPVQMRDILQRPAILALVYYHCFHICPQVLLALSDLISKIPLSPGEDYQVITVSFDENDTALKAAEMKKNYMMAIGKPVPPAAWRFLTGNPENIRKITDAVGFRFQRGLHGFVHPSVLVILGQDGKISRYYYVNKYDYGVAYPVTFPKGELERALIEASQGKTGMSVGRPLLFCFPQQPKEQDKFFSMLSTVGIGSLVVAALLFIYLVLTSRKTRRKE
jgi:protein SCO1/2